MSLIQSVLSDVEAFLASTGMPATTFGLRAVNDGKFVSRLRRGAGLTLRTVDRVQAFMASERKRLARRKAA